MDKDLARVPGVLELAMRRTLDEQAAALRALPDKLLFSSNPYLRPCFLGPREEALLLGFTASGRDFLSGIGVKI